MSAVFPHVDICALKRFAAAAAAGEHAFRLNRSSIVGVPTSAGKRKGKGKANDKKPLYPVVAGCEDFCHVGEQVRLFRRPPLFPVINIDHFPPCR